MFGISLNNNGKRSQLPSKAHIDMFYVARRLYTTLACDFIYGQNMLDFHFIDSNHVTNPVYQVIIVKSRPQSI